MASLLPGVVKLNEVHYIIKVVIGRVGVGIAQSIRSFPHRDGDLELT